MEKKPAKTVAERQRDYKKRHRHEMQNLNIMIDDAAFKSLQRLASSIMMFKFCISCRCRFLNIMIDDAAFKSLQRLASMANCSQREILENLLHAELYKKLNELREEREKEKLLGNENKDVTK